MQTKGLRERGGGGGGKSEKGSEGAPGTTHVPELPASCPQLPRAPGAPPKLCFPALRLQVAQVGPRMRLRSLW